jgi:hypothetical protein
MRRREGRHDRQAAAEAGLGLAVPAEPGEGLAQVEVELE